MLACGLEDSLCDTEEESSCAPGWDLRADGARLRELDGGLDCAANNLVCEELNEACCCGDDDWYCDGDSGGAALVVVSTTALGDDPSAARADCCLSDDDIGR